MAGGKALTPEQNQRVRAHVRDLLIRKYDGNQTACASALGMRQPTLSRFLAGFTGTSYGTVERIAQLLGLDERDVLGKAPPASAKRDRRALAAELVREDALREGAGEVDELTEAAIERMLARPDVPGQSTVWYVDQMRLERVKLLREGGAPKGAKDRPERSAPDESGARPAPAPGRAGPAAAAGDDESRGKDESGARPRPKAEPRAGGKGKSRPSGS